MNTDRNEKGKFVKGNKPKGAALQSHGEAAANGAKGGIASGKARRERKRLRELAEIIANEPINTKMPDGTSRNSTFGEAVIIGQYREAMKGKTEAAKFIATLLGDFVEKKEETLKAEVKTDDSDFDLLTDDEKDEIVRKIQDAKHARYMEQRYGKADRHDNE